MNSKGRIDVGISSSLVDLKAELLKKHAELASSRSRQGPLPSSSDSSSGRGAPKSVRKSVLVQAKNPYSSKNKGIDQRAKRDLEEVREEQKTIEKAKSILEQKAKLYEKMTSEALDHDEQEHPVLSRALVNFTQKAIDKVKEVNDKGLQQPQKIDTDDENDEEDDHNDGEWTQFTDGLGRTRRCLKTDLASFLARDDEFLRPRPTNPSAATIGEDVEVLVLTRQQEEQRLMELKRQKWEKEAEQVSEKESVHYQDVLYDEVRTHGVGFYGFSKDESERAEQLKELKKISQETLATRDKVLKERSAKKSALQNRLKKIKAKKRAKLGLPPQPEEDDDAEEEEDKDESKKEDDGPTTTITTKNDDDDGPSASKKPSLQEQKDKRMRAWDFGKPGVFGSKPETFDELDAQWMKDRRADRLYEFAPPKSLYDK